MDSIWWTKLINTSRFLDIIVNSIQQKQSVLLQLPETIPWYTTMQRIIEAKLSKQSSMRTYKYIIDTGKDPGEYLFYEFCKKEKRAHYRPGIGYPEFLAKSEDIVLNDYILWITGLNEEQLKKWYSFVENYNKALGKQKQGCIFLIETRLDYQLQKKKGIKEVYYEKEIEYYDTYLFHMLASSGLKEKELFKKYLAETVSTIFPKDIELSSFCISYGRKFLNDPMKVIEEIVASKYRSNGSRFKVKIKESEIQERLWEAQVKVVFPIIEKHRNTLIRKYQRDIEKLLPISTAYGEILEDVNSVELGIISYLAVSGKIPIEYEDLDKVMKLKNARNVLAHIGTLSQQKVDEIFSIL